MDNETREVLTKILNEIEELKNKVNKINNDQIEIAQADHQNWHMLADKFNEYDMVLYKLFGKKNK